MSTQLAPCPQCASEYTYESGEFLSCPMCGHEWLPQTQDAELPEAQTGPVVRDTAGNVLADGDTVTIVKDLKVKGASGGVIKVGTKVQDIQLITDGIGDHDIDARVPGFGQMQLKSTVVRKVI